jgi:hypothetical protein
MGDRHYSYPPMLAQEILRVGVATPELRDELYCQLMKQLSSNPSIKSATKGIELFNIMLQSFAPSDVFNSYVEYFLRQNGERTLVQVLHSTSTENNVRMLTIAEIGKVTGEETYAGWLQVLAKGRLYDTYRRKWFMLEENLLRFFVEEGTLKEEQGHYNLAEVRPQ